MEYKPEFEEHLEEHRQQQIQAFAEQAYPEVPRSK